MTRDPCSQAQHCTWLRRIFMNWYEVIAQKALAGADGVAKV